VNPEGPYVLRARTVTVGSAPLHTCRPPRKVYTSKLPHLYFESCSNCLVTVVNSADKIILQLVLL